MVLIKQENSDTRHKKEKIYLLQFSEGIFFKIVQKKAVLVMKRT